MLKKKKTARVNVPIFMACVLLCLTLISMHLTSGLYARYTNQLNEDDAAEVVEFGNLTFTESGDFGNGEEVFLIPGVDLTKRAVINFEGSETATYIFAEINLSSVWETKDNRTFTISSEDKVLVEWKVVNDWYFLDNDNGKYVFYQSNGMNQRFSQDLIAEEGKIKVSEYITVAEIENLSDIFINIRASAVQNSGFDSPMSAWNSINK